MLTGECWSRLRVICWKTQFEPQLHILFSWGTFPSIFFPLSYCHLPSTDRLEYFQVNFITFWTASFLSFYHYIMNNLGSFGMLLSLLISPLHQGSFMLNLSEEWISLTFNWETIRTSFSCQFAFPLFRKGKVVMKILSESVLSTIELSNNTLLNCSDE